MRLVGFLLLFLACSPLMTGCSGSLAERRTIDYKSAGQLPPLEVPPDLSAPQADDRYSVPESGKATYSSYSQERGAAQREAGATSVLPQEQGMRVERAGAQRWLVLHAEPEAIWQPVRDFWQQTGFLIAKEIPEAGIMETDWAENRARIPQGAIRSVLGSFMDNVYSYPERDKYRTRIERGSEPGTSEIFVSHRGMYEVITKESRSKQDTMWQVRPSDPELEAEMLYRLMAALGAKDTQIAQARTQSPLAPRASLTKASDNVSSLQLTDPFDRAWRRVGLALDRVGFTVEDRDRSKGVYYVRYNDPDAENRRSGIAKLAFWRDDGPVDQQFQISVSEAGPGSEVRVLDAKGVQLASVTAGRILALLQDELK